MQPNLIEESTSKDDIETEYIENILKNDYKLYESNEESKKREEILIILKKCVIEAVKKMFKAKGKSDEETNNAGGIVYTFGSYGLGIAGPGDDIDVICLAPTTDIKEDNKNCERNDFFEEMRKQLENISKENDITQILPVIDAKIPIIKIICKDIRIDILIAIVNYKSIDENFDIDNDNVLKNCCEKCILSLNGRRDLNIIFKSLQKERIEDFRLTLRAIKLWAKKRGIYSNAMGYLSGVSLVILVAKVCQLYPKLKSNKLIRKFFEVYSNWDWENPVLISEIKTEVEFPCPVAAWSKEETQQCPFYIIKPAFPAQNANKGTNEILRRVLVEEFNIFKEYSSKINIEDKNCEYTWKDLFKGGVNFFEGYNHFLQIDILSKNKSDFKSWVGFVESQLIKLICNFIDINQIKLRPFSNGYDIKDKIYPFCKTYLFGLSYIEPENSENKSNKNINIKEIYKKFLVYMYKKRDKKNEKNLRIEIKVIKDLPPEILQIHKDSLKDK